ncbi:MAG TPA: DNA polymerase III subunit gamma/tau, partial [Acidimicrobiia bacterium]|nr:DNA polymerase III subunit gamma/tau [Acidimicrobiia bacterium]
AKALNCLQLGDDGEPCGLCENCVAIAEGTFYDLAELDAASNNGVDSIRTLIQSVNLGIGATSQRKVYLIDEVHMLTAAASNSLLKTLEEPPEHVVFVLATTDPQKVLPTIRSRTQHLEFTLLSHAQLAGHLVDVLGREGIEADEVAVEVIARRAEGSARDALSLLDQALALGSGVLDASTVTAALGGTPFARRMAILDAVVEEDAAGALAAAHDTITSGEDPRAIADGLLRTLRDAFVQTMARGRVPYDGPAEEVERLRVLAERLGTAGITRAIDVLGAAIVDIRGPAAVDPRLVLEVAIVRLARRDSRVVAETLLERVERLERRLDGAGDAPPPTPASTPSPAPTPAPGAARSGGHLAPRAPRAPREPKEISGAAVSDTLDAPAPDRDDDSATPDADPSSDVELVLDDVIEAWPAVLATMKAPIKALIQEAQPIAIEVDTIVFGVPPRRYEATNERFRNEASAIKAAFAERLGRAPRFRLRPYDLEAPGALSGAPSHERNDTSGAANDREPGAPPSSERDDDHDHDVIDLNQLVDAPDAGPLDQVAVLTDVLGAQVVEERARD